VTVIEDLFGSWTKASREVLDPRTPEGWDLDALYADYLAGTTQKEIARRLGVDAEQVRQVFMRAGLSKRTRREVNVLLVAGRTTRLHDRVRDEVAAAYAETGLMKEVVRTTDVGYQLARSVLSEVGSPQMPSWRVACPNPRIISASEATRILREASKTLGGKMSAKQYRDLALTRVMPNGQPWPRSHETLAHALGARTWNETLQNVGLPVVVSTPGRRPTPVGPCFRVIRQLTSRFGRSPSKREYNEVASARGIVLSEALILRFGRRWENVLAAATEVPRTRA
jgi:hypothetical protein